jgi:tRNA nucleotidyltransferase (CCA-adding enzyme)
MGFDVDIVPCYQLKSASHIKSAVDRTPFHNKWISANLKPKQSKEVRLLKQFAKAHGIYGSDTKTLGLSGYLCELLVVHYGSFMGFIEAVVCWKAGKVLIDMERRYKRSEDAFFNKRFKDQPLIVIDPVDGERNVAAVMSHGNFEKLVHSAASFLEKPSLSAFFPPKVRVSHADMAKRVRSRGTMLLAVRFSRPDVIDDVLWPQLRRTAQRLENIMKEYEFGVVGHDVHADGECIILLELDKWKLPKLRRLQGPGVFAKERVDEFTKKYKYVGKVWQEKGIMFAEVPRTFRDAAEKLRDSLSDREDQLLAKGIASYVASSVVSGGFEVLEGAAVLGKAKKDNGFAVFLKNYLGKERKV